MNPKVKKGLVVCLSVFAVVFAALLILPFAFKGKIVKLAQEQINAKLDAKVDFDNLSLSFIRSFPNASVRFENLRIVGVGEFRKDTLLSTENIDLELNLSSLFSDKGYEIRKFEVDNSRVFAHVLANGKANWNIMKTDSTKAAVDTSAMSFNMKLKNVVLDNANIVYLDEQGKMKAEIKNLNHHTSGDFTADSSLLKTKTTIEALNFTMDGVPYLSKANVEFNADINANLNKKIFTFSENSSRINAIPFAFAGSVKDIYPLEAGTKLNGVLDMNLDLGGRMSYYETNQYDKFKFGGKLNVSNMLIKMKALPQDVAISKANMVFNNRYVDLAALQMKIGRNDISATGKLENFVAFALHNKTLKGTLNMQSNYFNVSDFMTADATVPAVSTAKQGTAAKSVPLTVVEIPKN